MSTHRLARTLLTAVAALAAAAGLSGCGGGVPKAASIAAIDVVPDKVDRIVFTDGVRSTEIKRVDGDWLPGKNGSGESIALLDAAEDRLLPVNAYRIIDDADQNDPNYGLAQPSRWLIDVYETGGKRWHLSVGRPSFNQAGYYAKVDGDPKVYLVISKTVSDIISIANGKIFEFDPIDKIKHVDQVFEEAGKEGQAGDLPDYDPWLTQTLAAESTDPAQRIAKLHKAAEASSSLLGPADKDRLKKTRTNDGPFPAPGGGTP